MNTYFSSQLNIQISNSKKGFAVPLRFFFAFIFLFQFSFFFAQDIVDDSDTLFVSSGTKIYSADQTFNKQIAQKKIIIIDESSFIHGISNKNTSATASKKKAHKKEVDFANQVKLAEAEKQRNLQKKVQKYIADFEKSQEKLNKNTLKDVTPSSYFFSTTSSSKVYLHQRTHQYEAGKNHVVGNYQNINLALEYLHTEKYFNYNNKSLDFCFSQIHSVRPPPILFYT